MLVAQEKIIGENTYKVTPFGALEAIKIKARMLQLFGPAIGKALGGLASSSSNLLNTTIDGDAISSAFVLLFEQLDENTFIQLLQRLLKNTIAIVGQGASGQKQAIYFSEGKEENYTLAFQGHLVDMYKVLFFVLQVNYPDFFDLIQNKLSGTLERMQSLTGQKDNESKNLQNLEK